MDAGAVTRSLPRRRATAVASALACALMAPVAFAASGQPTTGGAGSGTPASQSIAAGIHKIQHVIVVMQENRSFDSYFGTYPGANGIPMRDGVPTVCAPARKATRCLPPFHDPADINGGGPHSQSNAFADVDRDQMDGFVRQAQRAPRRCADPNDPVLRYRWGDRRHGLA